MDLLRGEKMHELLETELKQCSGAFEVLDTSGIPVVLQWEYVAPKSLRLNEIIKNHAEILVKTYTDMELEYSRDFPSEIKNEYFLKSLAPLFEEGPCEIDWTVVEDKIRSIFQKFFIETDFTKFSNESERNLLVNVVDKTNSKQLGLIQFIFSPEYQQGSVKAAYYGISDCAKERGIDKILMFSIFKIATEIKRIFLHTRITNKAAISSYLEWGFTEFSSHMPKWPNFEYYMV